ncbi:hypothetical protein GCT13_07555 [Paraburkholderia sp. CNPSo 3157]|uniref:Uncharacterized protein n=1 Tax=Paraburkholderia franconis TaxID=2654983 RepID=A0A7X1TF22_9BURK|nr:hypothetical protein [Paraburkholderia franconis]MPW16796.1 hypothetical protein [Paraburkholderia franconis]
MPLAIDKGHEYGSNRAIFFREAVLTGPIQTVKIENKAKFGAFASALALPAAFPNLSRPRAKR